MRSPESKIFTIDQAKQWCSALKDKKQQLVITNGCFDLLHRGHVEYLSQARKCGDALLIALNNDASIQALKGMDRPIVSEEHRAYMLASLECVDAVVLFGTPRATSIFRTCQPDIYVKGGDYCEDTLDREEYAVLQKSVHTFEFIPFVDGFSTTLIIEKIKKIISTN